MPARPVPAAPSLHAALEQINHVLLGKPRQVRMAVSAMLAGGHLLIEDVPGVGKTTLAHALAATFDLAFQRIQFTSDLLPSDIIGVSVYEREKDAFRFHPGPIFTQLLLADEINRATPKTQSALLEAMAEGQVTIDGTTHTLKQPFFVVATQNPLDLAGTFPLPDSQLDRFMLRLSLDYPDARAERELLAGEDRLRPAGAPASRKLDAAGILEMRRAAAGRDRQRRPCSTTCSACWRPAARIRTSASACHRVPAWRCCRGARAWALMDERDYVIPEDLQALFVAVAAHRLIPGKGAGREALARALLDEVAVE